MTKKLMGIVIVLLLMISFSGVGFADDSYSIGYNYIQHRVFENGKSINRLCVSLNDGSGNPLETNEIQYVKLLLIDGTTEVKLSDDVIIEEGTKESYSTFYSPAMKWGAPVAWYLISYYSVDILDDLIPNYTYKISVVDLHGIEHLGSFHFWDEVYLPVVSSKTFKYNFDEDGNLYLRWEVSKKWFNIDHTLFNNPESAPEIRAVFNRYDYDGKVWSLLIKLPYLMSGVFVPSSCGIFDGDYDHIEFNVQVRAGGNSYRTYSDSMTLKNP